ncbi:MAG: 3D domain-containing protein [Verrucomicrobia bacterium]|nr:3D domain-containing protein [Verrucomicrobiota bacterium]
MPLTNLTLARCLPAFAILALTALLHPGTASAGQNLQNPAAGQPTRIRAIATAYGSGPGCNAQWAGRTAIGTRLRSGAITSAAADWSKFPLGTRFRVVETGRIYEVDDYGSAMVGKMKVDLYTAHGALSKWGVRNVTLEILSWGSRERSLALLSSRKATRYAHIRKMVANLRDQLAVAAPKNS